MNLVHQGAASASPCFFALNEPWSVWVAHSPNVPGPTPPFPQTPPPEVPIDLPPEINDPPVPPEQPPIQEPPHTPGQITALL